jgi:hypothetical protein
MRGRVEVGPPGHRGSRLVVSLSPMNQIPFEDLATVVRRGLQPRQALWTSHRMSHKGPGVVEGSAA